MNNIAFSLYPLTKRIFQYIEEVKGVSFNDYLVLGELKQKSLSEIIKVLRGYACETLFIVISDHCYQPILPILLLLSLLTRAKNIYVIDFLGEGYSISRKLILILEPLRLLFSTIIGLLKVWRASRESKSLIKETRVDVFPIQKSFSIAYLKTNLWLGIQAGGSVGHVAGVVNGFACNSGRVKVYAVEDLPMLDSDIPICKIKGVGVTGLPIESANILFHSSFVKQVYDKMLSDPPRLIYQRNCLENYSGVILSRKFGIPLVIEYNGSEVWVADKWGAPLKFNNLAKRIEEINLKHAHLIVVVSDVLKNELISRGIPEDRIIFYPNCIDPRIYDPDRFSLNRQQILRNQLGIKINAVLCTFVGTFGLWHGTEILAKAIKQMSVEREEWLRKYKVHFMLVGDGQLMPQIRSLLSGIPAELFTLTGLVPQDETPAYLAASDVLLSPHVPNSDGTRFFGSPTKLFEYMAMEKGIVASDLDQIGEVLKNSLRVGNLPDGMPVGNEEFLAVLCEPGDVDSLIRGIVFQVENPSWRSLLGKNVRKQVLSQYTWEMHVAKIISALHLHNVVG